MKNASHSRFQVSILSLLMTLHSLTPGSLASPWPYANATTTPTATTPYDCTSQACATPTHNTTTSTALPSSPATSTEVFCNTRYPSEIRIMNSRYPDYDISPLHGRNDMVMLLRQRDDTFQIATQLQFSNLDAPPNTTCYLHFNLPDEKFQTVLGPQPIFNIYQVKRATGSLAMWNTFEARNITNFEPRVFGQVNGTAEAREWQWKYRGGLYDIGPTRCNETLTFQMGLAFNGGEDVNYWDFLNIPPPASPQQGLSIVEGC